MPKGVPNKRHTPEFKGEVVETILEGNPSCRGPARYFEISSVTGRKAQVIQKLKREFTLTILLDNAQLRRFRTERSLFFILPRADNAYTSIANKCFMIRASGIA